MLSHVIATLALALGLVEAGPQVVERDSPIPGYGLVDLSWEVQVVDGQPPHILTGTVQDVRNQILAINPEFKFNPPKDRSALPTSQNITARADVQDRSFDKLICCDNLYVGAGADTLDIRDGVSYLDGVGGKPSNGPGPGNCGRVSCSYGAAIFWCNDNSETYTLDSFSDIADLASIIAADSSNGGCNYCNHDQVDNDPFGTVRLTIKGQAFDSNYWNVIVKYDSC